MFRTFSCRTTARRVSLAVILVYGISYRWHTFIFSNVFQRKCQTGVLSLDDAHFAKCALANDPEEFEMIELDCENTNG